MATVNNLRPINEIVADIRRQTEADIARQVAWLKESAEEKIARVEENRQGLALLDGAGFDLNLTHYTTGSHYLLDLGFFPTTKAGNRHLAEKVRAVRLALDCRLEQAGKQLANADGKTVYFSLTPALFRGITVRYERKVPRGAKCKIVRKRVTQVELVCGL